MATNRIYEDQENQRPQARSKIPLGPLTTNGGKMKRAVLGQLNVGDIANTTKLFGNKPAVADLKAVQNKENLLQDKENSNVVRPRLGEHDNLKNIVNPIIPVAQFEAFKVYEDSTEDCNYAKYDKILKARSTNNVYEGVEDRFITKTELAEREGRPRPKIVQPLPMSIEKYYQTKPTAGEEKVSKVIVEDTDNFFAIKEYSADIYTYLREHEQRNRAKSGYMTKQPDVSAVMRTILVDWLVEVAEEYKLHTETLYLAINYIDRFLSYMSVVRAKLQLVGTSAMFLASKYEEIYPPDIGEFVYITDDTYTKRQVIRMEHLIVKVLGFDLSVPTPLTFINAMCTINQIEEKTKFLAMYLCELSLLEGETYLQYLPSQLAASSLILAQLTLEQKVWPAEYAETTGYDVSDLTACLRFLYQGFEMAPTRQQHAIQDKYKSQKYLHVSQIDAPPLDRFMALVA